MQNQINEIKKEYQEITNQLSTPSIVSDPQKMAQLGKRQAELQNVISVIAKYEKIEKEMKGNAEIMNSENDPELKEMAMNENINRIPPENSHFHATINIAVTIRTGILCISKPSIFIPKDSFPLKASSENIVIKRIDTTASTRWIQ